MRGKARVDDRRVISGIVHVLKFGERWIDAPPEYGPKKTLYNRYVRWAAKGVWRDLFHALTRAGGPPADALIDSSAVKAHRSASGGEDAFSSSSCFERRISGGLQAFVFSLPIEIGRLANAGLPTTVSDRNAVGSLLQDERLLRVRKFRRLHRLPLPPTEESGYGKPYLKTIQFHGSRSPRDRQLCLNHILIALNIFAFFWNSAGIGDLSGCSLDQG
jgi:transposase